MPDKSPTAGKPRPSTGPAGDCAGGLDPLKTQKANRHNKRRENSMFDILNGFITMVMVRMRREEGQTMAEYGILLGVIALVVVVVAVTLGSSISALFSSTATKL
jgi:Flp pilus assembly pilin Flp